MTRIKETGKVNILTLKRLIKAILSTKSKTSKLIPQLEGIIHYKDVLFYSWKSFFKTLQVTNNKNETFMLNALELLNKITPPKSTDVKKPDKINESDVLGISSKRGSSKFILETATFRKLIRKVWQLLINIDLSPKVHRKLLVVLLESYFSKLDNPIFLTDFLMASTNIKGPITILALQGMAMLMQKNNIDYPNIYRKLYTIFEPNIFHTKYKSRLFYLANIFLSSTHLPEALVASFAKRVSHLSLICATPDLPIILRFVGNLLQRHTGLKKMIHHFNDEEVSKDSFLINEDDPMKTHATESSLWEISLLKNHCQPKISSAARFIDFNLPSLEYDLEEVLSDSYHDVYKSECKKKSQKIGLTFERPQHTVAKLKDDQLFKLWFVTK